MRSQSFAARIVLFALAPVAILAILITFGLTHPTSSPPELPLSTALHLAAQHKVSSAVVDADGMVHLTMRNGHTAVTRKEPGQVITTVLMADGVQVRVNDGAAIDVGAIISIGLTLLLVAVTLYVISSTRKGAQARLASPKNPTEQATGSTVTFDDVAGVDEAKGELAEVVEFLASPERFRQLGARLPKGVLLSGPPGTGKTLLARAVAGEAGVPFFHMSGAAFVEMYVGVGAARVRDLFARARKAAPAIVFIDELDAVGGKRSAGPRGGNDEREHTLNQLLVELDGFKGDAGVVVLAATNRPDMLDAALLRPGRFDRRVTLGPPDRAGRAAVLALHAATVRLAAGVDLERLAGQTSGLAPAELANVLNEAALLAARARRSAVEAGDLEAALLRVLAGPELKSRVLPPQLKRVIAYHETGHALVMALLPGCDPVAKVQAIARGNALGITVSRPAEDQYLLTEAALRARLVGLMGGRAAEELIFGEVTTGAQQDIAQANAIARRMVTEWGMSGLGHISVGEGELVSPALAARVDAATRELVEEAYERARALVRARRAALCAIAEHLREVETLDGDELDAWLARFPADETAPPDKARDAAQPLDAAPIQG